MKPILSFLSLALIAIPIAGSWYAFNQVKDSSLLISPTKVPINNIKKAETLLPEIKNCGAWDYLENFRDYSVRQTIRCRDREDKLIIHREDNSKQFAG